MAHYYVYRDDTALGTGLFDRLASLLLRPGVTESRGKSRGYPVIAREVSERALKELAEKLSLTSHVEETISFINERVVFYGAEPASYLAATVPPLLHYGVRLSLLRLIYNTGLRRHIGWRHWSRPSYIVEETAYIHYASLTRYKGIGLVAIYASTIPGAAELHRTAMSEGFAREAAEALINYRHSMEIGERRYPVIHTDYYHGIEDKLVELGIRLVDAMIASSIHREVAEKARDIAIQQKTGFGDALQYMLGIAVLAARRRLGIDDTIAYYTFSRNLLLRPSRKTYRLYANLGIRGNGAPARHT